MAARLSLRDVNLRFGGIKVLEDVGFEVEPGQIFGLVGPNGAGKTSLFNCISGHYTPSSGSITHRRCRGARLAPGHARRARARPHVPASRAAAAGDRARERAARRPHPTARRPASSGRCGCPAPARAERALRGEALDLLERNGLGWAAHLPRRRAVATACTRASSCAARCCRGRGCCCSTSRPPVSRTPRSSSSSRRSSACATRTTSPSSSSSTTWASSRPSPTASSCSTTAASSWRAPPPRRSPTRA